MWIVQKHHCEHFSSTITLSQWRTGSRIKELIHSRCCHWCTTRFPRSEDQRGRSAESSHCCCYCCKSFTTTWIIHLMFDVCEMELKWFRLWFSPELAKQPVRHAGLLFRVYVLASSFNQASASWLHPVEPSLCSDSQRFYFSFDRGAACGGRADEVKEARGGRCGSPATYRR